MNKNYMEQVAQMLGVEIGETFYVVDDENKKRIPVYMAYRGFLGETGVFCSNLMRLVLCGDYEIQKLN